MIKNISRIDVDVVRKRVKHIRLKIARDGSVQVTLPYGCSVSVAESLVSNKIDWIEKHKNREKDFFAEIKNGSELSVIGEKKKFVFVCEQNKSVIDDGKAITIRAPENVCIKLAESYIKNIFLTYLQSRIAYFEELTGLKANELSVRKMKSRWGSCNIRSHKINFSFYLAFRPLPCIDYVVLHELVHTRIAAHNNDFYSVIKKYMPDYKVRIKLLRGY